VAPAVERAAVVVARHVSNERGAHTRADGKAPQQAQRVQHRHHEALHICVGQAPGVQVPIQQVGLVHEGARLQVGPGLGVCGGAGDAERAPAAGGGPGGLAGRGAVVGGGAAARAVLRHERQAAGQV
jgi:hypothetical protein